MGRREHVNFISESFDGIEASYIALSDGDVVIPMASSQDHKRIFDNDEGPNTGGMGAYSPTPIIDDNLAKMIQADIIEKTIFAMKNEGILNVVFVKFKAYTKFQK